MKAGTPLPLLLCLSLVPILLAPGVTEAFRKTPIKTATLDTKALTQLETYTSETTKSLEEINKALYAMVKERRSSICCYDVIKQEDELSLSLRSAVYTAIVAVSRLQDAAREYRQGLNLTCSSCDVPPGKAVCNPEDYQCPSEPGKCVTPSQLCDKTPDCSDASDEEIETCYQAQFQIECDRGHLCEENRLCIPASFKCDDRRDCPDGSDEWECYIPYTPPAAPSTPTTPPTIAAQCSGSEFKCISDGVCVPSEWRCDTDEDCVDGSDEASCPPIAADCRENEFQCVSSGSCVHGTWRCDGEKDCDDGSDEASCSTTTTPATTCLDNEFQCVSSGSCVYGTWRCDGEKDCDDGSDEASCSTTTTPATTESNYKKSFLQCKSDGVHLPAEWRCDGIPDCLDGSDEASCITTTTTPAATSCDAGQLKCPASRICLPGEFRCDGDRDCLDGSDEENCPPVRDNACEGNPCTHRCVSVPWANKGFLCTCPEGMELQLPDRTNCVPGVKRFKDGNFGTEAVKGNII